MESRTEFLGHPIDPMLVVCPVALLVTAVVLDALAFFRGSGAWSAVAHLNTGIGVLIGLLAAGQRAELPGQHAPARLRRAPLR